MTKVIETFPDGSTIERDLTTEELAQIEADKLVEAETIARLAAKVQAKAELLEKLGITEDEAKLLFA